ncbi:MAG: hypothetical protein GY821_06990 [Gammaproteobacteria bacterium]|nr:hypothetical protein [Gammaproteobacteria bacterium]
MRILTAQAAFTSTTWPAATLSLWCQAGFRYQRKRAMVDAITVSVASTDSLLTPTSETPLSSCETDKAEAS